MKCISRLQCLLVLVLGFAVIPASAVVIDFESLPDLTSVGATYGGVTFTNATAITAGLTLNEFEFPPHSGISVAFDDGGPITGTFAALATSVGFHVTYTTPVTFSIYNSSAMQVGQITSLFSTNLTSSSNPPNELMLLNYAGGIASFTIQGDPLGNSLVIDDLSFTPGTTPPVPDENAVSALGFGLVLAALFAARRRFGHPCQ